MHLQPSSISYDNIYLPKLLKALWVSKGWLFMKQYPLDSNEEVGNFLYWYFLSRKIEIINQKIEHDLYISIISLLHSYSSVGSCEFGLTPLQKIIQKSRPDLGFGGDTAEIDFQKWWIAYGAHEYNLKRFPMGHEYVYKKFSEKYIKEIYIDIFGDKSDYYKEINMEEYQKIIKIKLDNECEALKLLT